MYKNIFLYRLVSFAYAKIALLPISFRNFPLNSTLLKDENTSLVLNAIFNAVVKYLQVLR